ncbi:hypothetical protein CAC42_6154 [Sphaceloma murrayae]|uniref:Uncharacterized protein n=1 Tax=Sphaceloma murrayae TaxID=2082308 RepID=A0A2K1QTD8_9PEZI|nr:hypothetical protein CAC42_6154 [Sphaceloma murrayae]
MCIYADFICFCGTLNSLAIPCEHHEPQKLCSDSAFRPIEVIDSCSTCTEHLVMKQGFRWTSDLAQYTWCFFDKQWLSLIYGDAKSSIPQHARPECTAFKRREVGQRYIRGGDGGFVPESVPQEVKESWVQALLAASLREERVRAQTCQEEADDEFVSPEAGSGEDSESIEWHDPDSSMLSQHARLIFGIGTASNMDMSQPASIALRSPGQVIPPTFNRYRTPTPSPMPEAVSVSPSPSTSQSDEPSPGPSEFEFDGYSLVSMQHWPLCRRGVSVSKARYMRRPAREGEG